MRIKQFFKISVILIFSGFLIFFLSIVTSFLLHSIFGGVILVFPLSFIGGLAVGLALINKIHEFNPSFFKSLLWGIIIVIVAKEIFVFYWVIEPKLNLSNWYFTEILLTSSDTILTEGIVFSIVLAFLYRSK